VKRSFSGTKEGIEGCWDKYASWSGSLNFIGNFLNLVHQNGQVPDLGSNHLTVWEEIIPVELKKVLQVVEVSILLEVVRWSS